MNVIEDDLMLIYCIYEFGGENESAELITLFRQ